MCVKLRSFAKAKLFKLFDPAYRLFLIFRYTFSVILYYAFYGINDFSFRSQVVQRDLWSAAEGTRRKFLRYKQHRYRRPTLLDVLPWSSLTESFSFTWGGGIAMCK